MAADADAATGGAEAKGAADAAAALEDAEATREAPAAETDAAAAAGTLPSSGLRPDTRMAAAADTSSIPYLGVWAPDAAACATVDQEGAGDYLVISTLSVRRGSELALVEAAPMTDGTATITLGETTLELSMPGPDQLQVGSETLVRCTAP
jgi:hypothetical protein